jgi:hypothetical protein
MKSALVCQFAVALVVIVRFRDGKLAHEHIYWDQASVLAQLGLLDPQKLPIAGLEAAKKCSTLPLTTIAFVGVDPYRITLPVVLSDSTHRDIAEFELVTVGTRRGGHRRG